ncbi:hypothetical protein SteCoe_21088 [Stentor coeruleus]|uniref:Uncharacterized protein n=1 Tax=Stentor coeruleus TaxID=5963 RepID=A0A1R2BQI5_9CILI|nr:hypothetical protein SteCoe_21088 [Stentor coeruleus]
MQNENLPLSYTSLDIKYFPSNQNTEGIHILCGEDSIMINPQSDYKFFPRMHDKIFWSISFCTSNQKSKGCIDFYSRLEHFSPHQLVEITCFKFVVIESTENGDFRLECMIKLSEIDRGKILHSIRKKKKHVLGKISRENNSYDKTNSIFYPCLGFLLGGTCCLGVYM